MVEEPRMSDAFWADARSRMMLEPTVANLNTGSFGPWSRPVFDRVTELRRRLAEEPMDFLIRQLPPLLWEARERLAAFLGGTATRLVFTANVTASINIVASSLQSATPGEILLTDHEYGAMHWCWERAAQRRGLTVRTFPLPVQAEDPEEIIAAFRDALTEHTRLAFFSHVLSPTGLVLPVKEMCAEARRRGVPTMIDGAHAPAMVPVNLDDLPCDFYGGNCHKWLLAPTGSGFLYLGNGSEDRLQPLQVSWGWRHERGRLDEPDEFGSTPRLRFLEFEGTRDCCPWLAVPTAIDFQQEIGLERIGTRNRELVRYVREKLAFLPSATPANPALCGYLTAFRLPATADAGALRRGLWETYRIEAPVIERPEGLLIRASTHFYNTETEIELLAKALRELL
jgi:isopenicillin-N epimerase